MQIALDRIAVRVARGGHGIPEVDVRRRYTRSRSHLRRAVELADQVTLIDNTSEQGPCQVAAIDQAQIARRATDMLRRVSAALGDIAGRGDTVGDVEG